MIQKMGKLVVVFFMIMSFVLVNSVGAFALTDNDTTKPTIKSTKIDKEIVEPGGQVHIEVEAEDIDSGIKTLYVSLQKEGRGTEKTVFLTYNDKTQKYEGTYNVPSNSGNGKWELIFVYASDNAGNIYSALTDRQRRDLYQTFTITGGIDDTTKPTIKSTKIDKEIVEPGGQIHVEVEAEDLESGIKTLYVSLQKEGRGAEKTVFLTYNSRTQKYEGTYNIPNDAGSGKWELVFVYANDNAGNIYSTLTNGERKDLYQSFTITNAINDTTKPTIKSTSIDKKTVEPGGTVRVEVEAEDLESGIKTLYVSFQKEGRGTEKTVFLTYNERTQKYEGTYDIPSNAGSGKWELIFVYANDNAGNIYSALTDKNRTDLYQTFNISKDTISPTPPQVNEINDKDNRVLGTAEIGSYITVKSNKTVLATGTTDTEGKYSIGIPVQKAGTKLTVTATDKSGNVSDEQEVTVKDVTAPNITLIDAVTEKSTNVKGTSEVGAIIAIKAGEKVLGTGLVNEDGSFSVDIGLQKAGTKLTVEAVDNAGNKSEPKEIIVKDVTSPSIIGAIDKVVNINTVFDAKADVTATDSVDGDLTKSIQITGTVNTKTVGTYMLTYVSEDKSGNITTVTRKITVVDNVKPVISGATNKTVTINTSFDAKAGVTATDNVDGDLTKAIKITGTVNTKVKGIYTLTYSVLDKSNNVTTITRKITVVDNVKPVISGATDKTVTINTTFDAKSGITAKDNVDGDLTKVIKITGTVNTKVKGTYTLTYSVADKSGNVLTITRKITVVDNVKPVISGAGNKTIPLNTTFNAKAGVTAKDNIDGDLTKAIKITGSVNTKKIGTYTLTYSVADKSGNVTTITRKVSVIDNVKPVISGAANKTIKLNSTFNPKAGVTAKDNVDGDVTKVIKVTGTVNTKKKGVYTLTYSVSDKSNNKSVVTRKITVK